MGVGVKFCPTDVDSMVIAEKAIAERRLSYKWAFVMVNVRDLLAYNEAERRAFFKAFTKLSWREFIKNREASFHSIRNIFIHTLDNADSWLDFLQNKKQRSKKKFGEYKTLKEIETYMQQVEKHMHDYLETLSSGNLKKKYELEGLDGKPEMKTAEDIFSSYIRRGSPSSRRTHSVVLANGYRTTSHILRVAKQEFDQYTKRTDSLHKQRHLLGQYL